MCSSRSQFSSFSCNCSQYWEGGSRWPMKDSLASAYLHLLKIFFVCLRCAPAIKTPTLSEKTINFMKMMRQ